MKVFGKSIKRRRLNYGLSQYQLAEGICAQATISLIENRNNCPKLGILTQIGQRLNIPIHSVVKSSVDLTDIENTILQKSYPKAKRQLSRIPRCKFKLQHQMQQYFCYWGIISFVDNDDRNALYYFHKALNQKSNAMNKYYEAWANLGVSYVYVKQKDKAKSLEFAKLASQHLRFTLTRKNHQQIKLFVSLRLKLAKLFSQLGDFKTSNLIGFRTISDLAKIDSMYKLADVYTQISQNYSQLNHLNNADLARRHAEIFKRIHQHPESLSS